MWKNYGLTITLFILFLTSWVGQGFFQWEEFKHEQEEHDQPVEVGQFMPEFWRATFENWQSEFLQLFTFVILSAYLIHKNSPQSKDGDERMEAKIDAIQKLLSKRKS